MGILAWIVLGGIAGWIATLITGQDAAYGILGNIIIGILGALLGGFLYGLIGGSGVTGFNVTSVVIAVVGAVVVLWVASAFR